MRGPIQPERPELLYTHFASGKPVLSGDWFALGALGNWTLGKGACLIPAVFPERSVTSGNTDVYRFRVKSRAVAKERVWCLSLRTSGTTTITTTIKAPTSTGTAATYSVPYSRERAAQIVYVETISSPSATEAEISIEVKATGGTVLVDGIACYEQDRPLLTSAELGVDVDTELPRQPILITPGYGEVASLAQANGDSRRVGIWHLVTNDGNPWTKTTTGYQNLLQLGVPVLGHLDLMADTTRSVKWSAYAKVTGGTGHVKLTTTHSSISDVVNVTNTGALAWTTARSISIHAEDVTASDGLRSSTWDELQAAIEGPGGGQTLSVAAISIWNDNT